MAELAPRRTTAADTLHTPVSANSIHYNTAVKARARVTQPRQVMFETPQRESNAQEVEADSETDGAVIDKYMSIDKVLNLVSRMVGPFYADTVLDKDRTVLEWVESIETAMGNLMRPSSPHQLMVVQLSCKAGALSWMNRKLEELTAEAESAGRDLSKYPLSWKDDVRRQFIDQHVGTDTAELWLAKLSMLRLGPPSKILTPIELDSQFDTIARHVHPAYATAEYNGSDLLLVEKYREIIQNSKRKWFESIVRAGAPTTLKGWKEAVAGQWRADAQLKAVDDRAAAMASAHRGNSSGGYGGRVYVSNTCMYEL